MLSVAMIANFPVGQAVIDGGVQAVSAFLANGLIRTNRVQLNVIRFSRKAADPTKSGDGRITIHTLPEYRLNNLTLYRRSLRDLKLLLRKIRPDVVHGQGAGWEGYLAIKSGYPSVVTFHGIIGEDAKHASSVRDRFRLHLQSIVAERFCVKYASHVVSISPYVNRYYGRALKGTSRLVPNPVDPVFYELEPKREMAEVLFAGRLIPRKGILDLIRAFKMVVPEVNATLRLAGSLDDSEYVATLRRAVTELELQGRVQFLGLLDQNGILREFSRATVLVLPSYQETAPMVVQQAMAAKLPVIATSICGVPDQLDNGKLGWLVTPGDVQSLAASIKSCLTEEATRQSIVQMAFEKALREFHVDVIAARTIDYYHEILSATSR